jgi:hypothetical protein
VITHVAQLKHPNFIDYIASVSVPKTYLEVGVRDGDSVFAALRGTNSITKLILCDNWGFVHGGTGRGSHDHIAAALKSRYTGEVQYLDGNSGELLPTLQLRAADMSHVDGDHSMEGELSDLRLVWPRTRSVMVVHDIYMPTVWEAVSTFLQETIKHISHTETALGDTGSIAIWRV